MSSLENSQAGDDENEADLSLSILVKNKPPQAEVLPEVIVDGELDISRDSLVCFGFPGGEITLEKVNPSNVPPRAT